MQVFIRRYQVKRGNPATIESRYIAVIYDTIVYTAQQLQWKDFGQIFTHKRHPIPFFVSSTKENDRDILTAYCVLPATLFVWLPGDYLLTSWAIMVSSWRCSHTLYTYVYVIIVLAYFLSKTMAVSLGFNWLNVFQLGQYYFLAFVSRVQSHFRLQYSSRVHRPCLFSWYLGDSSLALGLDRS